MNISKKRLVSLIKEELEYELIERAIKDDLIVNENQENIEEGLPGIIAGIGALFAGLTGGGPVNAPVDGANPPAPAAYVEEAPKNLEQIAMTTAQISPEVQAAILDQGGDRDARFHYDKTGISINEKHTVKPDSFVYVYSFQGTRLSSVIDNPGHDLTILDAANSADQIGVNRNGRKFLFVIGVNDAHKEEFKKAGEAVKEMKMKFVHWASIFKKIETSNPTVIADPALLGGAEDVYLVQIDAPDFSKTQNADQELASSKVLQKRVINSATIALLNKIKGNPKEFKFQPLPNEPVKVRGDKFIFKIKLDPGSAKLLGINPAGGNTSQAVKEGLQKKILSKKDIRNMINEVLSELS